MTCVATIGEELALHAMPASLIILPLYFVDGLLPANLRRHPESALATVAVSATAWIVAKSFHSFVLRRGKRTPFGYGSRTSANRFLHDPIWISCQRAPQPVTFQLSLRS